MRPTMTPKQHRDCKIVVYLTQHDKSPLSDAARRAGVSASLYAAQAVRRALTDQSEVDDNPVLTWMRLFDAGDLSGR